jgi:hypothetical protein
MRDMPDTVIDLLTGTPACAARYRDVRPDPQHEKINSTRSIRLFRAHLTSVFALNQYA